MVTLTVSQCVVYSTLYILTLGVINTTGDKQQRSHELTNVKVITNFLCKIFFGVFEISGFPAVFK